MNFGMKFFTLVDTSSSYNYSHQLHEFLSISPTTIQISSSPFHVVSRFFLRSHMLLASSISIPATCNNLVHQILVSPRNAWMNCQINSKSILFGERFLLKRIKGIMIRFSLKSWKQMKRRLCYVGPLLHHQLRRNLVQSSHGSKESGSRRVKRKEKVSLSSKSQKVEVHIVVSSVTFHIILGTSLDAHGRNLIYSSNHMGSQSTTKGHPFKDKLE